MIQLLPSALVNHLWQSTLFVIAVWLAALALRKNAARVRCWLWTAASVKFLVPLSMLVSLGERFQWRAAPAAVQPTVSFVLEDILAPANLVVAAPAFIPQSPPFWPSLLLMVWCAGATVVLMSWWRHWLPIRAALRRATPVRLGAEFGATDLTVMSSPSMPAPGVVGTRHPRLLLPEGLVERLTPAQLRALIAHERCHIRCRDNLTAAIHMAVEALFWFHPAVWWIEKRLVDERERACDEAVLRSGARPSDYAEGILEVCRQSVEIQLACVAGVSGSNLRARVEAIMRNEIGHPMKRGQRWALAVAVVAAVGGPVAGGALTAQSQVVVPPAAFAFEIASITPSQPLFRGLGPIELTMEARGLRAHMSPAQDGRYNVVASPLHLIQAAYNVSDFQIEGAPSWVRSSDRYAVDARAPGNATPDQIRAMLQSLLADRFKLTLRRETRRLPVYELVVTLGGLKIVPMKEGECIPRKDLRWDRVDRAAPVYICGGFSRRRVLSQTPERIDRIEGGGISMPMLVDFISDDLGAAVIDKTGFAEPFNLVLDFAPLRDPKLRPSSPSARTIFAAVQEQLGLRLVSAEAPVEVLVIDRVERPAEN